MYYLIKKVENEEFQEIIDFWKRLFPEIHSITDLNNLLLSTSNQGLETAKRELADSYKNNDAVLEVIDKLFSTDDIEISSVIRNIPLDQFTFLHFVKPFILYSMKLVKKQIEENNLIHDKNSIYESMFKSAYIRSYSQFYRTIILEINVARERNLLKGETPEERFAYYITDLLCEKDYLEQLYMEYKGLTILLFETIQNHINYFVEILNITEKEKENLERTFGKLGKVANIELSAGDSHSKGKTVGIITFVNDTKLVFKPHSMQLDKSFNDLIAFINDKKYKNILDLKYAQIYANNDYGWMEYIEFKVCENKSQVSSFYKRIGQYLCVLYSLNAKDFHHENLIACGEHPYLIDLEALLHIGIQEVDTDSVQDVVSNLIAESVYSIYLLPTRSLFNEENGEVNVLDIGGTGTNTIQKSPFRALQISENNTDTIRIKKDYSIVNIEKNNPQLGNTVINSGDFIENIQEGFENMYNCIMQNKSEYLSLVEGLFSFNKCRIICKPTFMYSQLLQSSMHPELLREPIHRSIFLNRIGLAEFIGNSENISYNEYLDLLEGDIPYFSVYANEKDLINSRNEKVGGSPLVYSPIESVRNKINNFSQQDLKLQTNIIDFTFMHSAKSKEINKSVVKFSSEIEIKEKSQNRQQYLETAIKIGEILLENSLQNSNNTERTWVTLMVSGKSEVFTRLSWAEHDLYKGNSGIALYFSFLGSLTGEEKFKKAAIESIQPCIRILDTIDEHPHISIDIGAFTGISGVIYSLFHIGENLNDNALKQKAYKYTDYLINNLNKVNKFEIISGASGALSVLMSLYNLTFEMERKRDLLYKAEVIGNHIINNVTELDDKRIFWGPLHESEGYTGFAHGTSGITTSLIRLYQINKDERILKTIQKALNFENSLFSNEKQNWKTNFAKEAKSVAWCHGASGILLNRGLLQKFGYVDNQIANDLNIALGTSIEKGFGTSNILCHGITGNLAIFYEIADILNDQSLKNRCDTTYLNLYNNYIKDNWDKNSFRSVNVYGLMIGLSGIGYSLLKYGCEYDMPNVLWLE